MKHGFEIIRLLCSSFLTTDSPFAFVVKWWDEDYVYFSTFSAIKPCNMICSGTRKVLDRKLMIGNTVITVF